MEEEEIIEEEVVSLSTISVHNSDSSSCILCCSTLPEDIDKEEENDKEFLDKLVKFEEELNEVIDNSDTSKISKTSSLSLSSSRKAYRRGGSIKNKRVTVYQFDKKVHKVCRNCKILMTSAFTSKSQLDEMEKHVRYLQTAILRALKVVDRHLKIFNRDLNKIGEIIKLSEDKDSKITHKISKSTNRSKAADVLGFRQCILNAVTSVNQFRKEKQSRTTDVIGTHREAPKISLPKEIGQEEDDPAGIITASQLEMETEDCTDDPDDNWASDPSPDDDLNMENDEESDHDQPSLSRRKNSKISSSIPTHFISDLDLLKESPRPILGKRYSSILEPVTSSMSPFKAAIVKRTFNKTKRKPRQTEPEGPLAYHYVTYNVETDKLSVDNQIEIRFNELSECLECTQCSYSCKCQEYSETNRNTVEKKMMYHILGKHLNIFKCEECDKQMTSYHQYFKHREIHKKMGSGAEPVCELCGKVLKSVESFEDHKWVHMTEEEKEEMRRQGKKDPKKKYENLPRRYQCQVCGKGFRRPSELKKHMRGVHGEKGEGDEGEKEPVLCGGCGVVFSQMGGLTKHLKLKRCKGSREDNERRGGGFKEEMMVE